jgi:sugar lactone lactonase YvrE
MKKFNHFFLLMLSIGLMPILGCEKIIEAGLVSEGTSLNRSASLLTGPYNSDITGQIVDYSGKVAEVYEDVFTQIASGVDETEINFKNTDGDTIRAFITRINLNTPGLLLRTATPYDREPSLNTTTGKNHVQVITGMGKHIHYGSQKVLAGINGDFYDVSNNIARGPVHRNGVVWKDSFTGSPTLPQQALSFVGVRADGTPFIAGKSEYLVNKSSLMEATGAGVLLIQNGLVVDNSSLPQLAGEPRTAIGYTAGNLVYMLVVDGRAPGYSMGARYSMLSAIMKALQVENAVNLDGGGSSTKMIRMPVADTLKVINQPSDIAGARAVANGWVVVANYQVSTVAGSTTYGFVNGTGTAARFRNPDGVVIDNLGDIIVTDRTNHSIRKMTSAGVVTTVAGNGIAGYANGIPGQFNYPWQSAIDAAGNIIVVEKDGARIRKIATNGSVGTIAGTGIAGFLDGTGAKFNNPLDAVVDSYGNIFVVDRDNKRIRKITTSGVVSTFVGDGTVNILKNPIALAIDLQNNLYVSDANTIKRITPSKVITKIIGDGVKGFNDGIKGQPLTAQLGDVFGLCFDNKGRLFLADASNHVIRKVTPSATGDWTGSIVTTIAGTGIAGKLDGLANLANFNNPYDVVADASGRIYVADNLNNCIRRISY